MAKALISLGTAPTGQGGDTFRTASQKNNENASELYTALGAPASGQLPAALPVANGGTGRADGKAVFSEAGVNSPGSLYSQQGMYFGWNANGTGEGNFTVNRGGGTGGFTWRSVNQANNATGPTMTYSYGGVLSVPQLSVTDSPIAISSGGTSATTAAQARTNLGLGPAAIAAILGTVSQSGGTPTGSIYEFYSNSVGQCLRFADGTQVCWTRNYSYGPLPANTTVNASWTPPLPFAGNVSAVFVSLQFPQTSDAALINRLGGYQVGGSVIVQGNFNVAQAYTLAIFAIGRWY